MGLITPGDCALSKSVLSTSLWCVIIADHTKSCFFGNTSSDISSIHLSLVFRSHERRHLARHYVRTPPGSHSDFGLLLVESVKCDRVGLRFLPIFPTAVFRVFESKILPADSLLNSRGGQRLVFFV